MESLGCDVGFLIKGEGQSVRDIVTLTMRYINMCVFVCVSMTILMLWLQVVYELWLQAIKTAVRPCSSFVSAFAS